MAGLRVLVGCKRVIDYAVKVIIFICFEVYFDDIIFLNMSSDFCCKLQYTIKSEIQPRSQFFAHQSKNLSWSIFSDF